MNQEKQKAKIYSAEFRESSVKLAINSDLPIAQTARDLGINPNTLHTWINKSSAPGFFAKAEMGSIRFQRRKIFLAVIAFGGPRSSCSGRGAQLPFGTLCATGLRK